MSRKWIIALAVIGLLLSWPAYNLYSEIDKASSDDPLVWEQDVKALISNTQSKPGGVLFMGSSSIRFWDTLAQDMAPLETIKRGFGGAKFGDALYYATELVNVEDPAAIVVFVGTNDIHPGATKPPEVLLQSYKNLISTIRKTHRSTPIYYIAITTSLMRWEVWPIADKTNQMIEQFIATDDTLHFIDTGPSLMHEGQPNKDHYIVDGLHLSESGYAIWATIIRTRLLGDLSKT